MEEPLIWQFLQEMCNYEAELSARAMEERRDLRVRRGAYCPSALLSLSFLVGETAISIFYS